MDARINHLSTEPGFGKIQSLSIKRQKAAIRLLGRRPRRQRQLHALFCAQRLSSFWFVFWKAHADDRYKMGKCPFDSFMEILSNKLPIINVNLRTVARAAAAKMLKGYGKRAPSAQARTFVETCFRLRMDCQVIL